MIIEIAVGIVLAILILRILPILAGFAIAALTLVLTVVFWREVAEMALVFAVAVVLGGGILYLEKRFPGRARRHPKEESVTRKLSHKAPGSTE